MPSNFNDNTPAAPTGTTPLLNVKWQTDGNGNDSAYYKPSGNPVKKSVSSSGGVLTIDASTGNSFRVVLFENITNIVINNPTDGQEITIMWIQNTFSSPPVTWTVTFPASIHGGTAPSEGPNSVSVQRFAYDATNSVWYAMSAGVTGM